MRISSLGLLLITAVFLAGCAAPSHFKCYQTAGAAPGHYSVRLKDQFFDAPQRTDVGRKKYLCAPAEKEIDLPELPLPVIGPQDHLVCYIISGKRANKTKGIANQLERRNVFVDKPELLCVPTVKGEPFEEGEEPKKRARRDIRG